MNANLTLLSFASRQIWPQVLSVLKFRPDRLVLFHTDDDSESKQPAERLKRFFEIEKILPSQAITLRPIPHDSFQGLVDAIADTASELSLDEPNCQMNLTGGDKLMAVAASEWCRRAEVSCFYLARDFRIFQFQAKSTELSAKLEERIDPHLAKLLDPLRLLECHLASADIAAPGQRLSLNEKGRRLPDQEFQHLLKKDHDFTKCLHVDGQSAERRAGDKLEVAVAFALLKLDVPVVQRGVCLAPRVLPGTRLEEGELDLVFNWSGKLWLVDCKDRLSAEDRVEKLRAAIFRQTNISIIPQEVEERMREISSLLRESELKPLKEDLFMASEIAGLLGKALCVRRAQLPPQARQFATSRRLKVILKEDLLPKLRAELHPD
ncbi:MAG: hypothetical protein M2R45_03546 [Verrucomicrobia subdivision 3 bacterium]|nr:hypothetical protein [Limisphaerales bacterium]MCS1416477.1 hypothetical protein [Limisphaerales bacterium]